MNRRNAVPNLCWARMDGWSKFCLAAACVLSALAVGALAGGHPDQPMLLQGWSVVACAILFEASLVRPLHTLAREGCDRIWPVCALSAGALVLFLVAFYWAYFCFVGNLQSGSGASPVAKVLDLPPVLGAIWAAATGWYVHFQLTGRNHRVAHAMAMVMGTRTNAEFLKRHELLREVLPSKDTVTNLPRDTFKRNALKLAREKYAEAVVALKTASDGQKLDAERQKAIAATSLKQAKAIDALQYTLNYYEFMAAGIRYGDLDERLFYETISPAVIGLCERAEPYLQWIHDPVGGNQKLAFEYLKPLVKKWQQMTAKDEANAAAEAAEARST